MNTALHLPRSARARKVAKPASLWTRTRSRNGLALGVLSCTSLLWTLAVQAQNAPPAPNDATPAPVAAPLPVAPDISVLIVALDGLDAIGAPASTLFPPNVAAPIVPQTVPPTVTPGGAAPGAIAPGAAAAGAIAPIVPADTEPVAVTPTAFGGQLWQWRALAQKKSKEQKKREKEAEEQRVFNLNPVAPTPYTRPGQAANAAPVAVPDVIVPGVTGQPVGVPAIVRAPGSPLLFDDTPTTAPAPRAVNEPGRSQLVAVSLRRALLAQGYRDVQVVTPESATVIRAIGEGRLTSRVLDELKRAMATLADNAAAGAPADVSATIVAGRAASRIGQATGYRGVVAFHVGAPTAIEVVGVGAGSKTEKVNANMIVADAQRESVEPLSVVATGDSEEIWRENRRGGGRALARRRVARLARQLQPKPRGFGADPLQRGARRL